MKLTNSLEKIINPISVVFNEEKHTYTHIATGEMYTGCTTISDAWDKSFIFGPWYAKEMMDELLKQPFEAITENPKTFELALTAAKGAAKRKSEKAKLVGKLAHEYFGNLISGKNPELPDDEEAKRSAESFKRYFDTLGAQWIASEEIVASDEYKVAGTLDALAVIDGITYIVDFKTSNQLSASYILQCAGYDIMLREMGMVVSGYLVIRTPKDGGDVETLTITDKETMGFARDTFLKQREAHKFYVFAENKLKENGKIKTD